MNKDIIRQAAVIVAAVATLVINGLANALPLNGQTTGAISDSFDVFFVPAGYVFSIWGVIYIGIIAYAVYQALPAQRENPRLRRIAWPFILASVANSAWIFFWHYELFALSLVAMLLLLGSLIHIYLRLGIGRSAAPTAEKWLVRLPFSIYLGWITVATIANVTILLDYLNWSGWGISPPVWTVIMLAVGVIVGLLMMGTRGDIAYVLVLVWAFIGIAIKQAAAPLVATTAWVATALLVAILIGGTLYLQKQGDLPPAPIG